MKKSPNFFRCYLDSGLEQNLKILVKFQSPSQNTRFFFNSFIFMAILVTGKSTALGQKQPCPSGQWNEMTITKAPKIVQFAVGHEGLHRSGFCV